MTRMKRLLVAVMGLLVLILGSQLLTGGPAGAYPDKAPSTISINPAHPQCGKDVTVSGQHFKPGEVVHITVNGHVEATTVADKHGDFSVTFPLNCHGADGVTITATGANGDVDSLTVSVRHDDNLDAQSGGGGPGSGGGGGTGGLSYTGVAVVGIGSLGVVLLLAGGLFLFAGKRRRVT